MPPKNFSSPLYQRIVDRVKREFGYDAPSPAPTTAPNDDGAPQETLPAGLLDRIKERIRSVFKPDMLKEPILPSGPVSPAAQKAMIKLAGKRRVCLVVKYNSTWRLMEPYSFRRSSRGEPRFFAFCLLHNKIHGIYLSRVQGMVVSNQPFVARWVVEV